MHVLHLLDASAGWEQRVAVAQLLAKLPAADIRQSVATIDAGVCTRLNLAPTNVAVLPRRLGLPALAGAALRAHARNDRVDLIHAWGVGAAVAARAAFPEDLPIAVSVYDPGLNVRRVRALRTIGAGTGFAVVCAAERVRRCLVEQGVPFAQTVLLRPGVDFAAISAARRNGLREKLELPAGGAVMLTPAPPTDDEGHRAALWSVMMRWYLDERVRIVVPGAGPGLTTLRGLARASECPPVAVFTEERVAFEELCPIADFLVIGSCAEISMTAIAWAMAAAVPIIAPATYATAEMLSDGLNALLFKAPANWRRRGAALCAQYDRTQNLAKIREVARGQAYEVFSLQRTVAQHRQLYENLTSGAPPDQNITDPAMVTT